MNNYHIFWGGEDVSPIFYGKQTSSFCGRINKQRDINEITLAKELITQGIPLIGICRGAQLLNVVNRGTLLQHIENHAIHGMHTISTYDNQTKLTTSTHHQMMVPTEEAEILAWDNTPTMGIKDPGKDNLEPIDKVYEVIFYPKTKCFCIQGHPEWMQTNTLFVNWLKKEIKNRLNIDVNFHKSNDLYFMEI